MVGLLQVFPSTYGIGVYWACLGDLPPGMPRRPEIRGIFHKKRLFYLCVELSPE